MLTNDQAKRLQFAEIARQNAPDKKCGRLIHIDKHGKQFFCNQIVKLGMLCPACGKKVE